jgi:hypothetical protein
MNLNGIVKLLNRITYRLWEIGWSLIGCICGNICESCKGEELLKSKRNIENKILEFLPTQKKRDWAVVCLWIVVAIFLLRGDENTQVASAQATPYRESYAFQNDVKPTKVESVEKPSVGYATTQSKSGEGIGGALATIGVGVLEGIGAVVSGIADCFKTSRYDGESQEDYEKRLEQEKKDMEYFLFQMPVVVPN